MNKYKYSWMSITTQWLLGAIFILLLAMVLYRSYNDFESIRESFIGGIAILGVGVAMYSGEYLNRYVEFRKEYVCFNSFRIVKMKKVMYFNVRYEDILSITGSKLPVIGLWKVKVEAKNCPDVIPVTFSFCRHNELYSRLCELAKGANEDLYIDDAVSERISKYKSEQEIVFDEETELDGETEGKAKSRKALTAAALIVSLIFFLLLSLLSSLGMAKAATSAFTVVLVALIFARGKKSPVDKKSLGLVFKCGCVALAMVMIPDIALSTTGKESGIRPVSQSDLITLSDIYPEKTGEFMTNVSAGKSRSLFNDETRYMQISNPKSDIGFDVDYILSVSATKFRLPYLTNTYEKNVIDKLSKSDKGLMPFELVDDLDFDHVYTAQRDSKFIMVFSYNNTTYEISCTGSSAEQKILLEHCRDVLI